MSVDDLIKMFLKFDLLYLKEISFAVMQDAGNIELKDVFRYLL